MRQTKLFTKVRHEAPKGETSKNAKILLQAGYINKRMAGAYEMLPLGLRSFKKVENIVREEMDRIGGQELIMSSLQDEALWEKSGRWCDKSVDTWFKSELSIGGQIGFGWTHEEPIAAMSKHHINSYRDLPKYVYQIQTKFRNEKRAKSGILRGREFVMKDLYSLSKDRAEHEEFYEKICGAYEKIYQRMGIGDLTYKTFASGGAFSKFSHEFQTVCEAGEDIIYIDKKRGIAVNKEVFTDEVLADLQLKKEDLVEAKAAEVGNVFTLGTRFSEAEGMTYKTKDGKEELVFMGSYGIGIGRLLGVICEIVAGDKAMVLPKSVSPYDVHLLCLESDDTKIAKQSEELYSELSKAGVDVLFDDRGNVSVGEKFADSDLIGIPFRLIVSARNMADNQVEFVDRIKDVSKKLPYNEVVKALKDNG